MNELDRLIREMRRDRHGRYPDDPLWGLPHSKCSCAQCVDWRAKNAHKLGSS